MSTKQCKNCAKYVIKSSSDFGGLAASNYGFCKLQQKPVDFWNTCAKVCVRGDHSSEDFR